MELTSLLERMKMTGGHGFDIAWNDLYVIDAAGFWLKLWRRGRRAMWRGRSPWGVCKANRAKVIPNCLNLMNSSIFLPAASSSCTAR